MKSSQEDVILIKNLYLSKQYGARRALSELPDKGWKLGSIDSLLNRSHKTRNTIIERARKHCQVGIGVARGGGPRGPRPPLELVQKKFQS